MKAHPGFLRVGPAIGKTLELEAERAFLQDVIEELVREGCRTGQGYLFARPLDTGALENDLREHRESDWAHPAGKAKSASAADLRS